MIVVEPRRAVFGAERGARQKGSLMAAEIKLPELAENFKKGQVVEVKIAPGDTVQKDQTLLVIDAEKATLDAVAPMAGKITQVLVKVGDEIKLNQTYCYIEPVG